MKHLRWLILSKQNPQSFASDVFYRKVDDDMAIASKVKSFATKGFDKTKAATTAVSAAMMVAAAQVMPVFCDLNPDNFTDEKVLNAV